MRLIRVYTDGPVAPGSVATLAGSAAEHVRRVLRLRAGDPLTLFNGDGHDYPGRVLALPGSRVEVEVSDCVPARAESPLALTLVQGVARGERMDLVMQKATELGVGHIVPVQTARSVVRLEADAARRKQDHWQGIVVAACEQCGRARLPAVEPPSTLAAWLDRPAAPGVRRLQLDPAAAQPLAAAATGVAAIELLVGPEGGLDDAERDAAAVAGYLPCTLGPRVLRSETAAIAALAVLQAVAGDLA
jgi:16S rRNA (uracil1498-N3)-methyltransferase